ncbi:unnamed protein product [Echinostoma caproni]|uniref:Beige/BEACH domain containing protein n=1 Tax=Echinostoma caproni TaxID=27848 RepID=A0A183A6G1_9TREM|nr:unnamed protein product [Echinostoma caproni]
MDHQLAIHAFKILSLILPLNYTQNAQICSDTVLLANRLERTASPVSDIVLFMSKDLRANLDLFVRLLLNRLQSSHGDRVDVLHLLNEMTDNSQAKGHILHRLDDLFAVALPEIIEACKLVLRMFPISTILHCPVLQMPFTIESLGLPRLILIYFSHERCRSCDDTAKSAITFLFNYYADLREDESIMEQIRRSRDCGDSETQVYLLLNALCIISSHGFQVNLEHPDDVPRDEYLCKLLFTVMLQLYSQETDLMEEMEFARVLDDLLRSLQTSERSAMRRVLTVMQLFISDPETADTDLRFVNGVLLVLSSNETVALRSTLKLFVSSAPSTVSANEITVDAKYLKSLPSLVEVTKPTITLSTTEHKSLLKQLGVSNCRIENEQLYARFKLMSDELIVIDRTPILKSTQFSIMFEKSRSLVDAGWQHDSISMIMNSINSTGRLYQVIATLDTVIAFRLRELDTDAALSNLLDQLGFAETECLRQ